MTVGACRRCHLGALGGSRRRRDNQRGGGAEPDPLASEAELTNRVWTISHGIPAQAFPLDAKRNLDHMSCIKTCGSGKVAALCH